MAAYTEPLRSNISNKYSPINFFILLLDPVQFCDLRQLSILVSLSTLNLNGMNIINNYSVSKATRCLNHLNHAMYGCTHEAEIH